MKVYVSSHCIFAGRYVASMVQNVGHTVVSRWHEGPAVNPAMTESDRAECAVRNFNGILEADTLILVASRDKVLGGKFVEVGYALGHNKNVWVLGHRENLLMYSPNIKVCADIGEILWRLPAVPA